MAAASLTKQVHRLMKTVGRRTDGQASVVGFEPDLERPTLQVAIEPNAGLYKGGRFTFTIRIPSEFPHTDGTPSVWCESKVYHPNIDTTDSRLCSWTNVCLNILSDRVYNTCNSSFGLEAIVQGLMFLMHNPNFEDPLKESLWRGHSGIDSKNVRRFMAGEEIFGGQVFALERAEKYKDKKDGDVPDIADTADAKDKIVDESLKLIVNTDNKENTNVATEDDAVENGLDNQRNTEDVTNANRVDSDEAAPKGAASSEFTLVSEDAAEQPKVNACTENESTAKEADNDNEDENDEEDDVYTGGYKLVELDGELVVMVPADTDLLDELTTAQTADDTTDNQTNDIAENVESATDAKEVTNEEDDVYTGGYTLVELDGELVMVPAEDTDLLDELTTAQTADDTTDNQTNDIAENVESATDAKEVTNNAQPKDTTDVANDAEGGNEATAFVQEDIKPPLLDPLIISFEKVFRKLATNVQYIGGRLMGCLKCR